MTAGIGDPRESLRSSRGLDFSKELPVRQRFLDWLDHRIGHRKLIEALLLEDIPGGARLTVEEKR